MWNIQRLWKALEKITFHLRGQVSGFSGVIKWLKGYSKPKGNKVRQKSNFQPSRSAWHCYKIRQVLVFGNGTDGAHSVIRYAAGTSQCLCFGLNSGHTGNISVKSGTDLIYVWNEDWCSIMEDNCYRFRLTVRGIKPSSSSFFNHRARLSNLTILRAPKGELRLRFKT